MSDFINLTINERRELERKKREAIESMSPTAKAAFKTAIQWGGGISPELAQAIAKAVLDANETKPEPEQLSSGPV